MPAKKPAPVRGKTSPRASPGGKEAVAVPETYDITSLLVDDTAATPHQKSSQAPQKASKKKSSQDSSGSAANDGAADTTLQSAVGETEAASLAESSLQLLVDGKSAVSSVTETILSVYRGGDKERALCTVLNVLAKASGVAEVELDVHALVDGVEIRPVLEELYARVPEDSEAYLLVNKDVKYRRFRRTFSEWCASLMQDGFASDVLLDETYLPVLSHWIIAMSESKSRSFRHTATVTLLAFVQALSSVAADLQSQLALLRTKKDISLVQRRRDKVVEWRDHIFSQAIHQRLRDIAPDIRLDGFQALRRWMLSFPDEFMTNKYLRYLGMPLHDKRPELRAEALDTILQVLARVPDAYSRLHLFLQYFTSRLVELSSDVDVRCAELAIRVVAMMVRSDCDAPEGSELLSNERVDQVLLTLFDERPTIRAAAGILLKVFIHCRTAAEESETAQLTVATELLCSFAATLRVQYQEAMPERYLIDAIWTPERPPLLLTAFQPILAAAQSDKPLDAVVGLQLIASLLLKVQGRLTLGPLPKDDRRGGALTASKKIPPAAKEEAEVLLHRLSEDAAHALCSILEVHCGSEDVLQAAAEVCAALDLSTFTSQRHQAALSALLVELRKATLNSSCTATEIRESLTKAWHQLAFVEHPLRSEANAHLQELHNSVVTQFSRVVKAASRGSHEGTPTDTSEVLRAWARMNLASALVSIGPQWPLIQAALTEMQATHPPPDVPLVLLVVGTAVQCLLWQVSESAEEAKSEMKAHLREVVTGVLQYQAEAEDEAQATGSPGAAAGDASVLPRAEVFVYLCDILALPSCELTQVEQKKLMRLLRGLYEQLSAELCSAQDCLKMHVVEYRALQQQQQHPPPAASSATSGLAELVAARRTCSRVEALQVRLVTGVARLFIFQRLDAVLAAPFLSLWTSTPSKAVSDTFKSLFHTLRDRAGDGGFTLERDILLAAYHHCAEVGATPVSVETLYQMGLKLSSLHFVGTDRFYSCCPSMARFGADFATSTDPLLLQAVSPYAGKLRPADALHLLRDELSRSSVFTEAKHAYVRAFVTALRKAAKLDGTATSSSNAGKKRQRAPGSETALAEEEGMLNAITEGLSKGSTAAPGVAYASARPAGRGQHISVASRVVTADGWRVCTDGASQGDAEDEVEVDVSQGQPAAAVRTHRSIVSVPTTQETTQPSFADALDRDEVFVATEEYE
ncbi:hypothetical protein LSCM1_00161 [Leishmania martiniquensis]|uniref:SCD domain-containing protein n=1 Tax=Leishmania martiniquensis TaxID=1580590 RepID=A0A836KAS0_9TRYP|nr:hypothetical protein LSCM1_00161 [Leishmania martiniquensis]